MISDQLPGTTIADTADRKNSKQMKNKGGYQSE
jgi:hypothetical protein